MEHQIYLHSMDEHTPKAPPFALPICFANDTLTRIPPKKKYCPGKPGGNFFEF